MLTLRIMRGKLPWNLPRKRRYIKTYTHFGKTTFANWKLIQFWQLYQIFFYYNQLKACLYHCSQINESSEEQLFATGSSLLCLSLACNEVSHCSCTCTCEIYYRYIMVKSLKTLYKKDDIMTNLVVHSDSCTIPQNHDFLEFL